ncbi:putative petal formation-expressed [Helianthus annuus]|nr:putative petal formation-expressed [Helianthus annuus]
MSTLTQASSFLCYNRARTITRASIQMPKKLTTDPLNLPKLPSQVVLSVDQEINQNPKTNTKETDATAVEKLYLIMEAVADRVEMHKNIGEQRNNWNSLLLTSINAITLSAAIMAAIAATSVAYGASVEVPKFSSSFMYVAVTGMLIVMNKIQPSQLAEEQRNAARLLKQLHGHIQTKIAISNPTQDDVDEAMEEVLAIDRAYPLPLLGVMLEKFPSKVQAAVWWPEKRSNTVKGKDNKNGWNEGLEDEMKEIARVLENKDKADYLRLDEKFLMFNKVLALSGPLLTGFGAIGSALLGSSHHSWAAVAGVMCGVVASVVNSIEHGGQVGMVVEMYRSNAGFFGMVEESIELNLKEGDVEKREDGELFEMKLALQLGRSVQELRDLAASSTKNEKEMEEFGSKLF